MLELRDLARRYGDVVALDGISFAVGAEQMFGFVGPNGAGKTTTMRIILGVVHDPELLVLDEPFSGLDPVGVDVLSGVLAEYAVGGVPVIFSSHQLDLVERLCDAVAIVKDGRLVASGTVDELRDRVPPDGGAHDDADADRHRRRGDLGDRRVVRLHGLAAGLLVPLAARIYAGGILRTGSALKLREAWRASRT